MNRLLSANFMRLKHSKIFWICMAAMAGFALITQWYNYEDVKDGLEPVLESELLVYASFVSIAISAFAALFLGTEYSDGTIRNKVVIGHSRAAIYFSNLVTTAAASLAMCLAYLVVYSLTGIVAVGSFKAEPQVILLQILCSLVLAVTFSSIFTLLAMIDQNKAVSAVVCILLAFGLLFAGSYIYNRLEEPEYYSGYYVDESGTMQQGEPEKNPKYLSGTQRQVYAFANDFLPGCQQIRLASGEADQPWKMMGYSVIITVVTTAAGILIFKRKDLR